MSDRAGYLLIAGFALILVLLPNSLSTAWGRNRAFLLLVDFHVSPSASSTDSRLKQADKLFSEQAQIDNARHAPYSIRLNGITARLAEPEYQRYYAGRSYLEAAREAVALGYRASAISKLREAITAGTEQVNLEARLLLAELLREHGDDSSFQRAVTEVSHITSGLAVNFLGCRKMELVAVFIDEVDLELGFPVHIILVWKNSRTAETSGMQAKATPSNSDEWESYTWEEWLFQVGKVENLIPDGGFEQIVLPREGLPSQMPRRLYVRQTRHHPRLQYEAPDKAGNIVLMLHGQGNTAVGAGSSPVIVSHVNPSLGYLITGRYRTVGEATPRIGIRWLLRDADTWDENLSSYVVQQPASNWTRFAGIQVPPATSDHLQYWALNADADSHLFLDNLGLFPISLPCTSE